MNFLKIKILCIKEHFQEDEDKTYIKVFTFDKLHISNKDLVSMEYREKFQLSHRITNLKWAKGLHGHFSKKKYIPGQ